MNNNIPESFQGSAALQLIQSQGWDWKITTAPNILLEKCPHCGKDNHCYMEIHGENDPQKNRDGLFLCQRCGKSGNLYALKQKLGLVSADISSQKDWASDKKKIDALPDIEACHTALLNDEAALEYLCLIRGFSLDIIKKQKIGLTTHYFKLTGANTRALVFPYLVNGNAVWVHYRTLPDPTNLSKIPKDFASPTGWEAALYNGEILKDGVKEIVLVEGECNCIAAMDKGIENIAGVPGANIKKAEWIETIEKIGVEKVYVCYDKDKVGQKAAQVIASRIGLERCYRIILPDFEVTTETGDVRKGKDLNEWFISGGGSNEALQKLKDAAELFDVDGVSSTPNAIDEFEDELNTKGAAQKYTWPLLRNEFGPIVQFDEGDCIHILAEEKVGKMLDNDSLILLANGEWKRNGELQIGDKLASIDGKENIVTQVISNGLRDAYKVTFWDDRYVIAGDAHLWAVGHVDKWKDGSDTLRVFTTDSIRTTYTHKGKSTKQCLYIPRTNGEFNTQSSPLPIHPYLVGALIGDGSITKQGFAMLHAQDDEIADYIATKGVNVVKHENDKTFSFPNNEGLMSSLRELGLAGTICETKFIPEVYLKANKEARLELLRGLMDTDGTVSNRYGTPSYTTISPQLAKDFQYLIRSLGGICKQTKPQCKSFRYKGEKRIGQPAYILVPRMDNKDEIFMLPRKKNKATPRVHFPKLTFKSIEYVGKKECTCITVSHPSRLYITNDFIVTHNSKFAMNMLEYMVDTYKEDGVFICLEMTRAKQARMWVSHKAGIPDNLPKDAQEAEALTNSFKQALPNLKEFVSSRDGDLYFCYPKYQTADDVIKIVLDCIKRYGVKWIVLDNLQRLCDTTIGSRNRTQYLSELSKKLSQICKDFNVQIIIILQPNRVGESKLTGVHNVDGASQVAKDCDAMLILNRHRIGEVDKGTFDTGAFIQSDSTFGPEMLVTAGLSRYSAGGTTTVYFDGATSTVYQLTEGKIKAMNTKATANVGYENQAANKNLALDALKDATAPWASIEGNITP
jgi:replicative DNA helicase